MGASVSDDIALLNKLSSVGALHLTGAKIDQSEATDSNRGRSKNSGDEEQQPSSAERANESDQPSKRKQQLSQTKETKAECETKVKHKTIRNKFIISLSFTYHKLFILSTLGLPTCRELGLDF